MKKHNTLLKNSIQGTFYLLVLIFSVFLAACPAPNNAGSSNINPNSGGNDTDWDGDGLSNDDELYLYHTNPYDKDTDGDGYSDYDEIHEYFVAGTNTFNPLIADTPDIQVNICATPRITLKKTISSGETDTLSITDQDSTSKSSTESNTRSNTRSWEGGFTVGASFTKNWGGTTGPKESLQVSASTSWKWVRGSTNTFSESTATSVAQSYAETKAKSMSQTETYSGGAILVPVKIKNNSNISYVVKNIMLEAFKISYNGLDEQNSTSITNLYPKPQSAADQTELNATLSAGSETSEITFASADLPVATIEAVMNGLVGLRVEVAAITISSEDTKDFTKITTAVNAKTALLTVDYGPSFESTKMPIAKTLPETRDFQIATKRVPLTEQKEGPTQYKNLTLREALADCLPNVIVYYPDEDNHTMIKSINGVEGKSTNDKMEGDWFISVVSYENSLADYKVYGPGEDQKYNIDEILVHAGEAITVMYSVDKDGDGIPLREEELFGTDDDKKDTDGDTISDYEEITGWVVTETGTKTCTNPALKDTDADGIPDNEDPYPTISSALSNATLEKIDVSYTPFNSVPYDYGKSINLLFGLFAPDVMKNYEYELLDFTKIDPEAINSDGSHQRGFAFNAGIVPSSAFVLTPKLTQGSATYDYYRINGWAERGDEDTAGTYGNKTYAGITQEEYNNKRHLGKSANVDGSLQLDTLPIGKFKILIKVTSSDGSKTVWYVMRFDSPLEVPFKLRAGITNNDGDTANVTLSWGQVKDTRASNVLIVRYLAEGAPESFTPKHDLIIAAENAAPPVNTKTSPYYLVASTETTSGTDQIAWTEEYKYYFFTYNKDKDTNTISVSAMGTPVSESSGLPETFSVSVKFDRLTITDDFGDGGHEFELKWTIWKTLDNGTEEDVYDHTEEWEGDYDNVRASNWYSMANDDCTATFTGLSKNENHLLNIHVRLREVDDGGSDDDIDNINIDLVYDPEKQTLEYDGNKHSSGADSRSSLTPTDFHFGTPVQTRWNFDTDDGDESVAGYFDMTLLWSK